MDLQADGREADRILSSEVYMRAKKLASERIHQEWEHAKDPTQREALWHQIQSLDGVDRELRTISGAGSVAEHQEQIHE